MSDLRLVIFDVDGTLVDSQAEIMAAMSVAFESHKIIMPERQVVLSIVGLSLDEAFAQLCPQVSDRSTLVEAYKDAFVDLRGAEGTGERSVLFPGAREALDLLAGQDHTLLAVATGKSRRGLDKMLEKHGLAGMFHSEQVADHHPSKPNPSMILTALNETGVGPRQSVMLGDTSYDMDMGRAAGVHTVGVSWGYHDADTLQPDILIEDFAALAGAVDQLTGPRT